MLDFDLAEMYGIENRVLKQAVRRNLKRFEGEDFMFELTRDELSRSQIVTLNKGRGSNFKYMPFALELINQTLAELQAQKALADKPRTPIGFVTPKKKE